MAHLLWCPHSSLCPLYVSRPNHPKPYKDCVYPNGMWILHVSLSILISAHPVKMSQVPWWSISSNFHIKVTLSFSFPFYAVHSEKMSNYWGFPFIVRTLSQNSVHFQAEHSHSNCLFLSLHDIDIGQETKLICRPNCAAIEWSDVHVLL